MKDTKQELIDEYETEKYKDTKSDKARKWLDKVIKEYGKDIRV